MTENEIPQAPPNRLPSRDASPMSPLERAARVMLALDYPEAIGSDAEERYWDRRGEEYMAQARAVLTAIREPSEDGTKKGYEALDHVLCQQVGTREAFTEETQMKAAAATWVAMVDHALREGD